MTSPVPIDREVVAPRTMLMIKLVVIPCSSRAPRASPPAAPHRRPRPAVSWPYPQHDHCP